MDPGRRRHLDSDSDKVDAADGECAGAGDVLIVSYSVRSVRNSEILVAGQVSMDGPSTSERSISYNNDNTR